MAHWECSTLADKLQAYIDRQTASLERLTDKPKVFKKVQDDIVLLQDVLTYVQAETNIFNMVVIGLIGKALFEAERQGCNDIIICLPLKDTYKNKPKVGLFNPRTDKKVVYSDDNDTNDILIHNIRYSVHNIDGVGDTEPEIIYLNKDVTNG